MEKPEVKAVNFLHVESSNIKEIAFDNESRTLFVRFHNLKCYAYQPITHEGFKALYEAESVGGYFNKNIKDNSAITWDKVE